MNYLKSIIIIIILFSATLSKAQVSVSVNIGSPPMWGPAGYTEVRYYYLPDVEAYYDVESSMFIYSSGGVWVHRTYLPSRYRNYDLYGGYKVVLRDYRGERPYEHFNDHRGQYAKGYRGEQQRTIGERPMRGNPHQREVIGDNQNHQQGQGRNEGPGHGGGGKGHKR